MTGVIRSGGKGSGSRPVASRILLSRPEWAVNLQNIVPYEYGIELRNRFYEYLNDSNIEQELLDSFGSRLFTGAREDADLRREPTIKDKTYRHRWPFGNRQMTFGVGLRPLQSNENLVYRLAVRIQSPRRLNTSVLRAIRQHFHQMFNSLVSVRWTSPVTLLATNPDGDYKPWRGPDIGRMMPGAALNIAGGAVGSLCLPLKRDNDYFSLTSGHTIRDNHRGNPGDAVYSPPQPHGADTRRRVGEVWKVSTLKSLKLGGGAQKAAGSGSSACLDYALVKIDPSYLPSPDRARRMGDREYNAEFYPADLLQNLRIMKSAGKSPESYGTITATNFLLEAYDPITARAVFAEGLLEVELDEGNMAYSGDSGALLCVDDKGLFPAAKLLAGVRAAKLQAHDSPNRCAIYGVPLKSIEAVRGMSVV